MKKGILIVDDSKVARELLAHVIEGDPELKVLAFAESGEEALHWLQFNNCDAITMDFTMPKINGFDVTQRVMETKPLPIVIISAAYTLKDKQMGFQALEAGALAILEKPVSPQDSSYKEKAKVITDTLKMISGIKMKKRSTSSSVSDFRPLGLESKEFDIKAVGIGASLGGPLAISQILSELPPSFPVPIFIVQHMALGFAEGFAKWLQQKTPLKVVLAKDKEQAIPGFVYIGADNCQLEVQKGGFISLKPNPEKSQASIGRLFQSMASCYGSHAAGVILTGMGRDGAMELLQMKQKGAYTIAQDEASCVMYGIPKEAVLLGAARRILPLDKIAHFLTCLVTKT